jgi:hypothetical protein
VQQISLLADAPTDPELKKVGKTTFRNYDALRACVSLSCGSHDEWNIVRGINEKRHAAMLVPLPGRKFRRSEGRRLPAQGACDADQ